MMADLLNFAHNFQALDLFSFDEATMVEYLAFIKNLISAHPFYLGACTKMIVDNFRPSMCTSLGCF